MVKERKLIYPVVYELYGDHYDSRDIDGEPFPICIQGHFLGKDVKTGEQVRFFTFQSDKKDLGYYTLPNDFSENDILFSKEVNANGVTALEIDEDRPSFEEIQKEYFNMKTLGLSEGEISNILIEKYNKKSNVRIRK